MTRVIRRFMICTLLLNQDEQDDRSVYYVTHVEERIIVQIRTNVTGKYGGKNIFKVASFCEHDNAHTDCIIDSELFAS
jgi:hypothetical protein